MNRFSRLSPDDPTNVGGYALRAKLGSGGMGQVYLSFTPGGRPLALKVVRPEFAEDPEFRRRFRHEIAAAQRVQGIYTAAVIDADADAAVPWLATAYVPGPSLQQVVADHGPLPEPVVFHLVAGVAHALTAVHAAGLIHRDLKPANVLLAADRPRVIDFGIAHAGDSTSLTRTGIRIGTPAFMAPEQVLGRTLTTAADVFALGQLAVFAATGHPAFGEGQVDALLFRITTQPPNLGGCPPAVAELAAQCLAKEPVERPTAAQIIEFAESRSAAASTGSWLPPAVAAILTEYDPGTAPPPPAARPAPAPAPATPYDRHSPTVVQPAWAMPQPALAAPTQRSPSAATMTLIIAAATVIVIALIGTLIVLNTGPTSISTTAAGAHATTLQPSTATPEPVQPPPPHTITATAPPPATATVTTTIAESPAAQPPSHTPDPAGVVQDYYAAINRRDYQTAWQLGGSNLGQSYATFRDGFAGTAHDDITITGVSGDTVDVHLAATHTDGSVHTYAGAYTVRNGVITKAAMSPA